MATLLQTGHGNLCGILSDGHTSSDWSGQSMRDPVRRQTFFGLIMAINRGSCPKAILLQTGQGNKCGILSDGHTSSDWSWQFMRDPVRWPHFFRLVMAINAGSCPKANLLRTDHGNK